MPALAEALRGTVTTHRNRETLSEVYRILRTQESSLQILEKLRTQWLHAAGRSEGARHVHALAHGAHGVEAEPRVLLQRGLVARLYARVAPEPSLGPQ